MEGSELAARLEAAERSQRWLASRLGVSHTQVKRWITGELAIPQDKATEARAVLPTVPPLGVLVRGAIVKPLSAEHARKRLKVVVNSTYRPVRPLRCADCGKALEEGDLIARSVHGGHDFAMCLEHVAPAIEREGS